MSKEKQRRPRRKFTEEFKQDAVRLVIVEGYTVGSAAKAVGVSPKSLRDWVTRYGPAPESCEENATVQELQEEVQRLRKQLRQAELERAS